LQAAHPLGHRLPPSPALHVPGLDPCVPLKQPRPRLRDRERENIKLKKEKEKKRKKKKNEEKEKKGSMNNNKLKWFIIAIFSYYESLEHLLTMLLIRCIIQYNMNITNM
jgi:hypothetical protein